MKIMLVVLVFILLPSVLWGYTLPIVGETGLRRISIDSINTAGELEKTTAEAGYYYLIFTITEENIFRAKIPRYPDYYELRIIDVNNFVYDYDYHFLIGFNFSKEWSPHELMPDEKATGRIAFEVEENIDIKRLELVFYPGLTTVEPAIILELIFAPVSVEPKSWGEVKYRFYGSGKLWDSRRSSEGSNMPEG